MENRALPDWYWAVSSEAKWGMHDKVAEVIKMAKD